MANELKANEPGIVKIIGRNESARAYAIRDFLGRGDVPFEWIELKTDEQAREYGVDNLNDPAAADLLVPDGDANGKSHDSATRG